MPLGPWNQPPNFLQAMEAGTSAGTALRGQDIAEQQAADRLQLAYDQLASEERQRNEAMKARMQAQTASQMLKAGQIDMLSRWHQAQITNQMQREQDRNRYLGDALRQKAAELAFKQTQADKPQIHFGTRGEVLQVGDDGNVDVLKQAESPDEKGLVHWEGGQPFLVKGGKVSKLQLPEEPPDDRNWFQKLIGTGKKPTAAAPQAAQSAKKRVRVTGPDGQKGTIEEGDELPDGWKLAQ